MADNLFKLQCAVVKTVTKSFSNMIGNKFKLSQVMRVLAQVDTISIDEIMKYYEESLTLKDLPTKSL